MAIPIDDFVAATEQAKSYLSRFESAVSEFRETGFFMGEKYNVAIGEGAQPRNWTSETIKEFAQKFGKTEQEFFDSQFNDEKFNKRLTQLQENVGRAGFREERKRMRMAQNVTDVEDFSQEEWRALVTRNEELKALNKSDPMQLAKIFKGFDEDTIIPGIDDKLSYTIHGGAPELTQGKLDPNFTKGTDLIGGGGGDTKSMNLKRIKDAKDSINEIEKNNLLGYETRLREGKRQLAVIEEGGGFMSAVKPHSGVSDTFFGRIDWSNAKRNKVVTESAELASDLESSTGGRGTMWLVRAVKNFTSSDTRFIGGDPGEVPILGSHKPIAGLSSRVREGMGFDIKSTGGIANISLRDSLEKILERGLENPSERYVKDIEFAWMEKVLKEDSARVAAGQVPVKEIYGEQAYKIAFGSAEESQVAARVTSNAVVQTVEEGVEKVVRHSGATGRLLGAATEASAAVAGGINSNPALKSIGAAMTVLRGRL
jgi:hypothetical protein